LNARNGRFLRERQRGSWLFDRHRSGWRARVAVIFAHRANEAEAFPLERLDPMLLLAAVANRAAGHVQARRYRGVGDDAPLPDGRDQVIFADDALSVADQIEEKVENLWRNGYDGSAPPQLAAVSVERTVFEEVAQASVPTWRDSLARPANAKNQALIRRKLGAGEEPPQRMVHPPRNSAWKTQRNGADALQDRRRAP
jgi:hypothetical protein